MVKKALLFVNGEPPKPLPTQLDKYDIVACTDGAYHNYLLESAIVPQFIVGDLDSLHNQTINKNIQIIYTPDQNKTDFEKAILFLSSKGITQFDIFGANGHASDHFLGNLSVALQYHHQFNFTFHDNFCRFFFATSPMIINDVKDKIISLIPLSPVNKLNITGFEYPLTNTDLQFGGLISIRNKACQDQITINFEKGDLLVFIAL